MFGVFLLAFFVHNMPNKSLDYAPLDKIVVLVYNG